MKKPVYFLIVLIFSMFSIASAQEIDTAELPHIAYRDDNGSLQVYSPADDSTQLVADEYSIYYAWSPDGTMIAYRRWIERITYNLLVYDIETQTSIQLVDAADLSHPISWTTDGDILFSMRTGESRAGEYGFCLQEHEVYTVTPQADAEPEFLGVVWEAVGCGGGGGTVADLAYSAEAGYRGNSSILQLTPFGLVYSYYCGGGGSRVTDFSTDEPPDFFNTDDVLSRTRISPDMTMAAGVLDDAIRLLQLDDLSTEVIATVSPPDQLAWHGNDALFYTTREQTGDLLDGLSDDDVEQVQNLIGYTSVGYPTYRVSIRHVTLDGEDTLVYEADAFAIGRMQWLAEREILVFSQVENMERTIASVFDGTFAIFGADGDVFRDTVHTQVYAMRLDDEAPTLIFEDVSAFSVQPE